MTKQFDNQDNKMSKTQEVLERPAGGTRQSYQIMKKT